MTYTAIETGRTMPVDPQRGMGKGNDHTRQETGHEDIRPGVDTKQDVYEKTTSAPVEDAGMPYTADAQLVDQLKGQMAQTMERFTGMVKDILEKQGLKIAQGEGIWGKLAQGEFAVDEQTRAEARQAISPEGYWGVEQTSGRIVSFAKALVGGDPSRVEEMRSAFIKGYEQAAQIWGEMLPEITQQTYDASMKLFDAWAAGEDTAPQGEQVQTKPEE